MGQWAVLAISVLNAVAAYFIYDTWKGRIRPLLWQRFSDDISQGADAEGTQGGNK